ncbi:Aste57867_22479 [Aphanomyces stellatus]|uniref:Aste57867_22479 protein n=1 Tax=Aphanomyces stellatus TaxID=120398 RepID=A0A485LKC6_9STRA|nr:hypothetical protein As57867_022409 [Aphanomyces stellatus]VFT99139.1 Aste57867_22479 [Aphanomyces stellatus]
MKMAACRPVVYSFGKSSCSWRVRAALAFKGFPFDYVSVNTKRGENLSEAYRKLNPNQKIPALSIDGTLLTQSSAILAYLEETRPDPPLLPSDPLQRADIRSFCDIIGADIQPIQNLAVLREISKNVPKEEEAATRDKWVAKWVTRGFGALESRLQGTAGKYCYGDSFTLADIYLFPQVNNARFFHVDLTPFPTITRIANTLATEDAFASTHPSKMPDGEDTFKA